MSKPRKPLRRTAWTMLISGVVGTGLMFGASAILVSQGEPAGPGQTARWPAGTEIAVFRPIGPQDDTRTSATTCTVSETDGRTSTILPEFGERVTPRFTGPASITCVRPVSVLAGRKLALAEAARSPWVALPMFVAFLGILFFFPRFTMVWAGLSQPIGRWIRRRSGNEG